MTAVRKNFSAALRRWMLTGIQDQHDCGIHGGMCCREMTPPGGVRRGLWCSGCQCGAQSAVTSAMAVRVEDSSTMALSAANAPDGFVADKLWQEANVEQMRHADYLLLRYSPPTFPEWDGSTRAYVLGHFTLAVRHPNGRQPFELWKRTTPRAHGGAAPQTTAKAQRRLQQAADALVQRP